MIKVKIKYANLANATVCKKYATVPATTFEDINYWLKNVGAVTMGYSVGDIRFSALIAFLTPAKLRSDVAIRFYNADGKCVAKWVVQGISAEGNGKRVTYWGMKCGLLKR